MSLFEKHRPLLERALVAITDRQYWSAYPESPSPRFYDAVSQEDGAREVESLQGTDFELPGHPAERWVGAERSPFGHALEITYPRAPVDQLVAISNAARSTWASASVETRVGVCLEILAQLNRASHLVAAACSVTTGQPYVMAFQAGGPHAQERGLEAIAYAYEAMVKVPGAVRWEKPQGKHPPIVLNKRYRHVPRGIGLVIGCATFPTWNSYPALFADLVTGNSVIVKPHPAAILPLALTTRVARSVLQEQGFDPGVILLAPDVADAPITRDLALHPAVSLIDFTGGSEFGAWLRQNARHALVYTEEAGVNSIVIESTDDFDGMCRNIAFSLSLYSGQMCTAPQNLFVPRDGIDTNLGRKSLGEVGAGISGALAELLGDPQRAENILGAIQSDATLNRWRKAAQGELLTPANQPVHPTMPLARTASPLLRVVDESDTAAFSAESFGPISYLIGVTSAQRGLEIAARLARERGAITLSVYSRDETFLGTAEEAALQAGVSVACNLTGNIYVNQNAAFSDFHVVGANPAGTACLTDPAFVANRFRVVAIRTPA